MPNTLKELKIQNHEFAADLSRNMLGLYTLAESASVITLPRAILTPGFVERMGVTEASLHAIGANDIPEILTEAALYHQAEAQALRDGTSGNLNTDGASHGVDPEKQSEAQWQFLEAQLSQHIITESTSLANAENAYQAASEANQEATEAWDNYFNDINLGLREQDDVIEQQLQIENVSAERVEFDANYELIQAEQSNQFLESLLADYLDQNGIYDFSSASSNDLKALIAALEGDDEYHGGPDPELDPDSDADSDLVFDSDPDADSHPNTDADSDSDSNVDPKRDPDLPTPPPPPNPDPIPASPIVLNLNGSSIDTTGQDAEIHFDLNGNGFREQTGWITPEQGFLALDRNGDGEINDGTELFGNWTLLESGQTAGNGFDALAEFDDNGDGLIDAQDSVFSELSVWVDLDQDGISDSGELFTLEELGIVSISLEYSNSNHVDEHGNEFRQWGHYTTADGELRDAVDIWFQKDPTLTLEQTVEVPANVASLPDMQGFGTAHSLHQAMVRDESGSLQALVEQFVEETDPERRQELVEQMLFEWTGQTDEDQHRFGSRYDFVDGRKIGVLEAFTGHTIEGPRGTGRQYEELFHDRFEQWASVVYSQLVMQSHMSDIFTEAEFSWNEETSTWVGDYDKATERLVLELIEQPDQATDILRDYVNVVNGINPYNNANQNAAISSFIHVTQEHELPPELGSLMGATLFEDDPWLVTAFTDALSGDTENLELVQDWIATESDGKIFTSPSGIVDEIHGTAGDDLLIAGKNDQLYAGGGHDILIGAEGAQLYAQSGDNLLVAANGTQLFGGSGNDTYQIDSDVLNTSIRHNNRSDRDAGTLSFGEGVDPENLRLERHGHDLHFIHGDQQIVMERWFSSHRYRVGQIQFAGGDALEMSPWLQTQVVYSEADPGDQVLQGHSGIDHMVGHDEGVNELHGGSGDDTLIAGKNDQLYAGGGNDILIGAEGAQLYAQSGDNLLVAANGTQLFGGSGDDTFLFEENVDQAAVHIGSDSDQLIFETADLDQLWFSREGNHLLIDLLNSSDSVRVDSWFSHSNNKAAELHAGESVVTAEQIEKLVSAMAAFSPMEATDSTGRISTDIQEEMKGILGAGWGSAA